MTTTANSDTLFLQYLSTGQFECARLVFLQVVNSSNNTELIARLKKEAALVACGFRPSDWVYTPSCPSAAHLSWLCSRLLDLDKNVVPTFNLAASALLIEAGIVIEECPIGNASERTRRLATFLLSSNERLSMLLCGPSYLTTIVWKDLERFIDSDGMIDRILTTAIDVMVKNERWEDASALYGCSRSETIAPESLAYGCGQSDDIARMALLALLTTFVFDNKNEEYSSQWIFEKHASLCRYRGLHSRSLKSKIIRALREKNAQSWFSDLVEAPFAVEDSPRGLRLLHVLTILPEETWYDRIVELQYSISLAYEDHHQPKQTFFAKGNILENALQNRVDRLGFHLICAETLCGTRDSRSAKVAHELRTCALVDLINNKVPPFERSLIYKLGRSLSPANGITQRERKELNIIRFAVWIADLLQLQQQPQVIEQVQGFSENFLLGLGSDEEREYAMTFVLKKCLRLFLRSEDAILVVHVFNNLFMKVFVGNELHEKKVRTEILIAWSRLKICDVVLSGEVKLAMDMTVSRIIVACLDVGEWDLAAELADLSCHDALKSEAECGKAMELGDISSLPAVVKADIAMSNSEPFVVTSLGDSALEHTIATYFSNQQYSKKERVSSLLGTSLDNFYSTFSSGHHSERIVLVPPPLESSTHLRDSLTAYEDGYLRALLIHVSTFSELVNKSPAEVLNEEIPLCLVEELMRRRRQSHERRAEVFEYCKQHHLDLRVIVLDPVVRARYANSIEYLSLIDEIELAMPVQGLSSSSHPFLRSFFFPNRSSSHSVDDNRHHHPHQIFWDLVNIATQSRLEEEVQSEYSLENDDSTNKFEQDENIEEEELQRQVGNVEQEEKEQSYDWIVQNCSKITTKNRKIFTIASTEEQDMNFLEESTAYPQNQLDDDDDALKMAAGFLGLQILESPPPLGTPDDRLESCEKYDVINTSLATHALELCSDRHVRHVWAAAFIKRLNSDALPVWERTISRDAANELSRWLLLDHG